MRNWIAKQGVRRTEPEFELRDALTLAGCPICRLARRTAVRQLDIISYEAVNDIDLRAKLRSARGFCGRHAWQFLEEIRDPLGTALIYKDIINSLVTFVSGGGEGGGRLARIAELARAVRGRDARWLRGVIAPKGDCVICLAERQTEDLYVGTLLRELELGHAGASQWGQSDGLCLPHLRMTVSRTGGDTATAGKLWTPWVRRFGSDVTRNDDAHDLMHLIAAVHGLGAASRALLPAELAVDVQRRRFLATDRPLGEVEPDCLVCRRVNAAEAASLGGASLLTVCASHAWEIARTGRAAAIESLQSALWTTVTTAHAAADRVNANGGRVEGSRVIGLWKLSESCPVCGKWLERSAAELRALTSSGTELAPLCLGHQLMALADGGEPVGATHAIDAQKGFWRALSADLAEVIRKHDYRFQQEPRGSEQASPWRALDLVAGPRGLP